MPIKQIVNTTMLEMIRDCMVISTYPNQMAGRVRVPNVMHKEITFEEGYYITDNGCVYLESVYHPKRIYLFYVEGNHAFRIGESVTGAFAEHCILLYAAHNGESDHA